MKRKKSKLSTVLSVFFISFLIFVSSLNTLSAEALSKKYNHYNADPFNNSALKWNTTEVVSTESTITSENPSLAVDSIGNVHVAWQDNTDYAGAGTDWDIFYKHWEVSTLSWTTTEIVSTESNGNSRYPSIAVDSAENIHVVWYDLTNYAGAGADWDIFYKCWNSTSISWSTTEVISTESSTDSQYPSLATDILGNVYVTWQDHSNYAGAGLDWDIFYKLRNVSTNSWTMTEVVSTESNTLFSHSENPSLAVDEEVNVHIAWYDETNYDGSGTDWDIFYKHWNASTSSWTTTEVVSTESSDYSISPSLTIDPAGNVHVVWCDKTDYAGAGTDEDIFYKRKDVDNSSWTTTKIISTESTSYSRTPSLAIDPAGNVHVVWHDKTDYAETGTDEDIFYKRKDAFSSAWTTTEVVSTESLNDSYIPSLTVDSAGNAFIAWADDTNYEGSGPDTDIFYKFLANSPPAPELAFIVPNPTEYNTVYLAWNNVVGATTYYVYRSISYIWSVEGLVPLTIVSSSDYIDVIPAEGFYYYVIVAGNNIVNSSHSNCQYVEVQFPDLEAPDLATILPNPTDITSVALVWDDIDSATEYYIYRSDTYIWSIESLTPIATIGSNSYLDNLPAEGYYFYVIVASDGTTNSTHSNCEHILYELPSQDEFVIISSLILGTFVVLYALMRFRKKKHKLN